MFKIIAILNIFKLLLSWKSILKGSMGDKEMKTILKD